MSRNLRALAFVYILIICVSLLGSCKDDNNTSSVIDSDFVSNNVTFKFFEDGKTDFRIVYDKDFKKELSTTVTSLSTAFKTNFSIDIGNVSDDVPKSELKEILIGDTNREETATVKALFEGERSGRITDYIVCTVKDAIVVYADHPDAILKATEYLINTYINNNLVTDGIYEFHCDSTGFKRISILGNENIRKFKIVRPIYNVSYITQLEMEKLQKVFFDHYGYNVEIVNDQVASTDKGRDTGLGTLTPTESGEYEIIVGNCKRDNVNIITNVDTYEIRLEGKKIYLNGGAAYSTAMAVTEFTSLLFKTSNLTEADSVANGSYKVSIDKCDSATYYRYTWGDDFNGTEIDTTLWNPCWNASTPYGSASGSGGTYRGSSSLKNQYVKNGILYMDGIEHNGNYYGGLITTQGKMEYKFGYLEISRVQPKHEGFWSALYTKNAVSNYDRNNVTWIHEDPNNRFLYVNEIDVEECFGGGDWVYGNAGICYNNYAKELLMTEDDGMIIKNNFLRSKDDRAFWMDFHTFGYVLNNRDSVSFTCDGRVWKVVEFDDDRLKNAYDVSVFLRLGMAVNTSMHPVKNPTDKTFTEYNSFKTDYIHLYQLKGQELWQKIPGQNNWVKTVIE